MSKKLVVLAGPDEGRVFALGTEPVLLGRSRATDTQLLDPHVSRVHCQVLPENGRHVLVDFDSAGGTFVNGKQVTKHSLRPGDLIRIGATHLQFVEDQGAAAAAPRGGAPAAKSKPRPAVRTGAWAEALVGQIFHKHYEIGRPLARGQTGYVFHARDTRRNLPLALKVLDPRYTKDEKKVKKFVDAMKAVLPLRHPNLIRVYAAGRQGEHLWMAMEYVKAGESLAAVIGRSAHVGRVSWQVAARVGAYLARALEYAHGKKIVHQNVAPQNVILGRQVQETKLADLMLASALYADPTEPISAAGTPSEALPYVSPERTDGPGATVDARTDLYSLGATLYALLVGHPPFQAPTAAELIAKIRLEMPPTLHAAGVEAPPGLDQLLRRAMAKRPQDRYDSARPMLKDLEALAGPTPAAAAAAKST